MLTLHSSKGSEFDDVRVVRLDDLGRQPARGDHLASGAHSFALPFVLLLSRSLKRSARCPATVAPLVLIVRFLDMFWLVVPAFDPKVVSLHVIDLAPLVAVGGLGLWLFVHQLEGRPLLPLPDPSLPVVS